jgi:hypothetical protein
MRAPAHLEPWIDLVVEALVREIEAEQADIAVRAKETPDQFEAPVMQTGTSHRFPAVEIAQREFR